MLRTLVGAVLLAASCASAIGAPAETKTPLDQATQDYLEGEWSITTEKSSPAAACATDGSEEDYTIEFRNSGGSLLIVDDVDADFRMPITHADGDRNAIRLVLNNEDGTLFKEIHLARINDDQMKLQENVGNDPGSRVYGFAYRCAKPRHEVVAALPSKMVVGLSLRSPQGTRLVEILWGENDKQVCDRKGGSTELELELIGPASYSIIEWTGQSHGRTWLIIGSEMRKDGTIVFRTNTKSPTRSFTLKPEGKHFRVPELNAEFVRCTYH